MPEPAAEPALSGLRLNLRIVSVVIFNFASYLTIGLPLAVLPGYVHDVMGFSAFWAGLVISLQYFATLLSRPHAGATRTRSVQKHRGGGIVRLLPQWSELPAGCLSQPLAAGQPGAALPGPRHPRYRAKPGGNRLDALGRGGCRYATHWSGDLSNGIVTYGAMALGAPLGVACYAFGGLYGPPSPLWRSRLWRYCLRCRARQ